MANSWGNNGNSGGLYFLELQNHCKITAATKLKDIAPWKKSYDQPKQHIQKKRHYFVDKDLSNQSYGFSSSLVWKRELDWAPENRCFQTVVLEKTLESPLDCKGIQPVHPKGNQSWIFMEGLILKLRLHYFGHLMRRANSLEKTLMLGKIEGRRRGQERIR